MVRLVMFVVIILCLSWLSSSSASQHICCRTQNSVRQKMTVSG
jgi:hypothetical protein